MIQPPPPPDRRPPRWAQRLLSLLHPLDTLEEVEGDLAELYVHWYRRQGKRRADFRYLLAVLSVLPLFVRRRPQYPTYPQTYMLTLMLFRHNLLLGYRHFQRFRGSFLINLLGLSTGLACVLLIYLWVSDELGVDKFHQTNPRLFQVLRHTPGADGTLDMRESNSVLLPSALTQELPEVAYVVPLRGLDRGVLSTGEKPIKAKGKCAGKDFFRVFSFPLLEGKPHQVLVDPISIVISDELARNLFGRTDNLIGQTLSWDSAPYEGTYQISGVFRKPPSSSSLQFDFLFTYDLFLSKIQMDVHWDSNPMEVYLTVREGVDVNALNEKIHRFYRSKMVPMHGADWKGTMLLARYSDRYLYNRYEDGVQAGGRIEYVRLFSLIAGFILLIACVNFMNLSTAQAARRSKEVGIKKVVGARRGTLVGQYLSESLLMTVCSVLTALLIVAWLLPKFNSVTGKQLTLTFNPSLLLSILLITGVTGLLAGSYPALYLSGFRPATVLKGNLPHSVGETWLRKGLVVFQFSLSVLFIVSVIIVYQQLSFIQSKNLGYNKDHIIHFANEGKIRSSLPTFLAEVKRIPGVANASSMDGNLTGVHSGAGGFDWEGKQPDVNVDFSIFYVNYDLLETLNIPIVQGRSFSRQFGSDDSTIIFNEAAIAAMALNEPLGQTIRLFGHNKQVVGVAKNFHFESLYEKVKPACFILRSDRTGRVLVKLKAGQEQATLRRLKQFYQSYNAGLPLEYQFLDEDYQALYASEQRVATLSGYFAGLAILISCLGLFGLAAFTAERRRKEIGIRKVLGAGELRLIRLLSGEFTRLVMLAVGIALPMSFLLARQWLDSFAYRIDLAWWYFVGAGGLALLIACLTVGLQAWKAARINPIHSLRTE